MGAALAGGAAGAAAAQPAFPYVGRPPFAPVEPTLMHRPPLMPAERAACAAAELTRVRPRAGAALTLETIYFSGVTRDAPPRRLRGLLADLTGIHARPIVDVRQVRVAIAVTLAATGVPAFPAALGVGAAAGVLTLLPGADPSSPAMLGPRRRAQLSGAAVAEEAFSRCRRRLTKQVADVAARNATPGHLRALLSAHYRADLAAHAVAAGGAGASAATNPRISGEAGAAPAQWVQTGVSH